MADWATISSLATAGGTLVLAAVRSSNRAARAAEESLLVGLRPLLVPSRLNDPPQRINYADGKWVQADGSGGVAEATDEAVYLAMSIRNVGSGSPCCTAGTSMRSRPSELSTPRSRSSRG